MPSLFELVITFAQIGILSFGGGYASIGLVEKQVVTVKHWMSFAEFADIVAIDELTPGPVAINAATFVGNKMAGIPGGIAATLGAILPSCIIALIFARIYYKYRSMKAVNGAISGLKSMVVAMLLSTTVSVLITTLFYYFPIDIYAIDYISLVIFVIALIVLRSTKINPLLVMLGSGLLGLLIYPFI